MTQDSYEKVIQANWWKIAGMSWYAYGKEGRGIVYFMYDDTKKVDNMTLEYIPQRAVRDDTLALPPATIRTLQQSLQDYRPEDEVVLMVRMRSMPKDTYVTRMSLPGYSPVQAYKDHIGEIENFVMPEKLSPQTTKKSKR